MYELKKYNNEMQNDVISFFEAVLPESGRKLDLNGKHKAFQDIQKNYEKFWCMYDGSRLIGTVAINGMDEKNCELKALYLYSKHQGQGLGYKMISEAVRCARETGYQKMYLDTLSTSKRAIHLYESIGFEVTDRYNENQTADVFMVKNRLLEEGNDKKAYS